MGNREKDEDYPRKGNGRDGPKSIQHHNILYDDKTQYNECNRLRSLYKYKNHDTSIHPSSSSLSSSIFLPLPITFHYYCIYLSFFLFLLYFI